MILQAGMPHPRQLVRDQVVAVLTNTTDAGNRVTSSRVEAIRKTEYPVISVYTGSEAVDPDSAARAPRELQRAVQVQIVGWVVHTAAVHVADAMDNLALQIENVMDVSRFLNGTAGDSILERTDPEILDATADPIVGVVTLTYMVEYRTSLATGTLDDFLRAGVTTKAVGVDDNNTISDLVNVRSSP